MNTNQNQNQNQGQNQGQNQNPMSSMLGGVNKKAVLITLGAVAGVTAFGVAAAAVWNSKQMRAARAVKRTGKILYQVGTAMRNVSGVTEMG